VLPGVFVRYLRGIQAENAAQAWNIFVSECILVSE
jgi:hypothetical protein